jgi:hypothetical protein
MVKITAIVLNWNNFQDTVECIFSLKNSLIPLYKIILIDNGSTDNSFELLKNYFSSDETIMLIRNERNLGFAGGVNKGIQIAVQIGSDFIFLINNDAVIERDTILNLVNAFKNDDKIGIAGPRIYYYSRRSRIWQGGGYFSYLKANLKVPEKNLEKEIYKHNTTVSFLTGCAMLINKECIKEVGLFNEDYFFYYEDADYCLKALRNGFKLVYVPQSKVYHKINDDIKKARTSPFVLFNLARSFIIFVYSNFSILYFIYAIVLHFLVYTPYRVYQVIRGSRDFAAIKAWFKGTLEAFRFILKKHR